MSSLSGQVIAERYRVERLIGEGGMGAVYEARHTGTSRRVALKVITADRNSREEMLARFAVEARAAGMLESDHIAQVFDYGRDEERGIPFLAMEYLRGESLRELLKRYRPLPIDLALRIATQACRGLAAAHAHGVLHRDLKPGNIFLSERDRGRLYVKLLDFGVARIHADGSEDGEQDIRTTTTSTVIGSPLYMSPEQTNGLIRVDERSEVFALGVVIFELLSGKAPHGDATGIGELIIRVCSEQVPLRRVAPEVPEEVAAIIDRALALIPAERWPSVQAMLEQLEALTPDDSLSTAMLADGSVRESPGTITAKDGSRDPAQAAVLAETTPADGASSAAPSSAADNAEALRTTAGLTVPGVPLQSRRRHLLLGVAVLIALAGGWWLGTRNTDDSAPLNVAGTTAHLVPSAAPSETTVAAQPADTAGEDTPPLPGSASSTAAAISDRHAPSAQTSPRPSPPTAPRPPSRTTRSTKPTPPPPPPPSNNGFEEEM